MANSKLIIVEGPQGAGKTTVYWSYGGEVTFSKEIEVVKNN